MIEANTLLQFEQDPDAVTGPHPDSYLQWVPSESMDQIIWNEGEKFYHYSEWMEWLCNLLSTWGVEANGTLHWSGEDATDHGTVTVVKSKVRAKPSNFPARSEHRPLTLYKLQEMALNQVIGTVDTHANPEKPV